MGAGKKGRTVGSDAAKSAGEKALCAADDCISSEELERLRHEVNSVELEYFGGSGKGDPFIDYAVRCAEAGRRFSIHERGSYFTWHDASDKRGQSIKLNHNDGPILARLVVERVPQCLPFIELRRSQYDKVFAERAAYVAAQENAS